MDSGQNKRREARLLLGLLAGGLCGVGDILLGYYGQSGTPLFGGVVNTDITAAPLWQFEVSLVLGLAAAPLLWAAGASMCLYLREWANGEHPALVKVFSLGMKLMVLCVAAAHSVCCVAMMCLKVALEQGMPAGQIEALYRAPLLVPFAATNIWVTVSELLVSVSYICLVVKKVVRVPLALLAFNPVCVYLLMEGLGALVPALSGDALLGQLFAGGASFGYGLMFLACYIAAKKRRAA